MKIILFLILTVALAISRDNIKIIQGLLGPIVSENYKPLNWNQVSAGNIQPSAGEVLIEGFLAPNPFLLGDELLALHKDREGGLICVEFPAVYAGALKKCKREVRQRAFGAIIKIQNAQDKSHRYIMVRLDAIVDVEREDSGKEQ